MVKFSEQEIDVLYGVQKAGGKYGPKIE